MTIEVVYILPLNSGEQYLNYAWRFLESYHANPPGLDHKTTIVCNGCSASDDTFSIFKSMPNCRLFEHDNSGYDIGAFQHVAREIPCDMMVFFGTSAYLNGAGWLQRMVQTFNTNPNAQFGSMGNRGNIAVNVYPHIRTTGFWMKPKLLNDYPTIVTQPHQRHPFEHGNNCFTEWLRARGIKSFVVTFTNIYKWANWDDDRNGFHRGDQSALLTGDRICERPFYPRQ